MCKITIVVPCYNVEKYIKKAIQSFQKQTFKDFEVIFIDDCSTDNSIKEIRENIKKYGIRASVLQNEKNSGPSFTRKHGILQSKSEYVAFCDSDDWLDEGFLEVMYKATDEGIHDIAFCNYRLVYEDGRTAEKLSIHESNYYKTLNDCLIADMDGVCGGVFRTTLFENMVFPDIRNGEDMAIIPVLISKAVSIGTTDKCIYNYFQRKGSLSTTQTQKLVEDIRTSFKYIQNNIPADLYYSEIEYLGIRNLIYGALLNLFKQGYNADLAREICSEFEKDFPNWHKNKYINHLPQYKKAYLLFAKKRLFLVDLFGRMLFHGHKATNIPEALLFFRCNDDLAQRSRSWDNTWSYIDTIKRFWKMGYSGFSDYVIIAVAQTGMYLMPVKLQHWVYKTFLRR